MSQMHRHPEMSAEARRLLELLAEQSVAGGGGLSVEEHEELGTLLRRVPPLTDGAGRAIGGEDMDRAVGSLIPALGEGPGAEMPAVARERLERLGRGMVRAMAKPAAGRAVGRRVLPPTVSGRSVVTWMGWAVAAAAVAFAAIVYYTAGPGGYIPRPELPLSMQYQRLAKAADVIAVDWQATPDAQGVSGRLLWSEKEQRGFMRFKGMKDNDPAKEQYQLWIFDQGRFDKSEPELLKQVPVDGGVFDIAGAERDESTGEVIVPVNAKLNVTRPVFFAVTVEEPGGVVISKKQRVLVVASTK